MAMAFIIIFIWIYIYGSDTRKRLKKIEQLLNPPKQEQPWIRPSDLVVNETAMAEYMEQND
jgi:hypothetical protein